eukprot:TRINITY_DN1554_c0_g4_i2.p1 TRINITY_DN1554_c0_g4~~TRINITY_DN1554_c0_g4_i2.p1  ORF type:complete len:103 (+),score=11.55 TRINITY_DN1554_c0_g4_i2:54-362(+)
MGCCFSTVTAGENEPLVGQKFIIDPVQIAGKYDGGVGGNGAVLEITAGGICKFSYKGLYTESSYSLQGNTMNFQWGGRSTSGVFTGPNTVRVQGKTFTRVAP